MKLIWKILLTIVIVIASVFFLIVGIAIKEVISESSYHEEATWRSNVMFASPIFNEDLKNCSLTYTDSWEIKGLSGNECSLWFVYDTKMDYDKGVIRYIKSFCKLPKELYSSSNTLNWNVLIEQGYCYLDYNYNEVTSSEDTSGALPTYWQLTDDNKNYETRDVKNNYACNMIYLKDKISNTTACVVTDLNSSIYYASSSSNHFGTEKVIPTSSCSEICVGKNWLASQSDEFFPWKVLVYYDFNSRGGNPKVYETEILI